MMAVIGAAALLLSGSDIDSASASGQWRGQRAGSCPVCPSCPAGRASVHAAVEQQQDEPPDSELVCGGPKQVPAVDPSVVAATAALQRGPEQDLERWGAGFTRGDIEATMRRLGVNGNNDLHLLVEVSEAAGSDGDSCWQLPSARSSNAVAGRHGLPLCWESTGALPTCCGTPLARVLL